MTWFYILKLEDTDVCSTLLDYWSISRYRDTDTDTDTDTE